MIDKIPVCHCGSTSTHPYRHEFVKTAEITRKTENDRQFHRIDAREWPSKRLFGKCTVEHCNRDADNHDVCTHPWQGDIREYRHIRLDLPDDTFCVKCFTELKSHNDEHMPIVSVKIDNVHADDEIDIGYQDKTVYIILPSTISYMVNNLEIEKEKYEMTIGHIYAFNYNRIFYA